MSTSGSQCTCQSAWPWPRLIMHLLRHLELTAAVRISQRTYKLRQYPAVTIVVENQVHRCVCLRHCAREICDAGHASQPPSPILHLHCTSHIVCTSESLPLQAEFRVMQAESGPDVMSSPYPNHAVENRSIGLDGLPTCGHTPAGPTVSTCQQVSVTERLSPCLMPEPDLLRGVKVCAALQLPHSSLDRMLWVPSAQGAVHGAVEALFKFAPGALAVHALGMG